MINNGAINESVKDIKSKLEEINSLNISLKEYCLLKGLIENFDQEKNNSPKIKPNRIEKDASLKLIFLFIKP